MNRAVRKPVLTERWEHGFKQENAYDDSEFGESAMNLMIATDTKGSKYIQRSVGPGGMKRAWVQSWHGDKDRAGTGRYLNVVRCDPDSGIPAGNATDFPIYCNLPDEQILRAFVCMVNAITGCVDNR